MKKHYYAINWLAGRAACAKTGGRYGAEYHAFKDRSERDEWVSEGADFTTSRNYREVVKSSDSELRVELRLESDPFRSHEVEIIRH